ncbi:MAG TPA: carboxypeptidase-like regulatory domain-containing protein [Chthoniobacteraceae bacterium]|nr:carboxypeptidase-like regulatory domain-containing protein [Chthoniobacteraceae bacterium]
MNRFTLTVLALGSAILLASATKTFAETIDAREADKAQMLRIWTAVMTYKKERGTIPDHLSDLVPEFLPDAAMLVSAGDGAPGQYPFKRDPRLPCSYGYEFSAHSFFGPKTFREVKEEQMEEFGPVVPILRCFIHDKVLNLAYSGDFYESELFWEVSPEAKALMAKLGGGSGFKNGEFTVLKVIEDETGTPLAGAEVRVTDRIYHALPLPDRTLRTDAAGLVRVPLGPAQPPSRQLTVAVSKPGFYAAPESWEEGALAAEKTIRLSRGEVIGGSVQSRAGTPIAGAKVNVLLPSGDAEGAPDRLLATSTTDAQGRWLCEQAPKGFEALTLQVSHDQSWKAAFKCGSDDAKGKVTREALVNRMAVLQLEPAALVTGVVTGPDGQPLGGVEVAIWNTPVGKAERRLVFENARATHGAATAAPPSFVLKTDSSGRFATPWREPGELTISASPVGFARTARVAEAAPDMPPVDLRVTPARQITGTIVDTAGKPVTGTRVLFIGTREYSVEQQVAISDERGEFAWDGAPSVEVGLQFQHAGHFPSTEWIPAGNKEALKVPLRER